MNHSHRPCRVAVIGGGISGLAAAHRLVELAATAKAPPDVVVFEAGPRLGGVIHTERVGDCLIELGADSFIVNKPWAVDLCRRLGLEDRLIATDPNYRRALVLRKGRPLPVPDGFLLMAPSKVWPVLTSPIFSPLGKLRMGLECLIPRREATADESVASFVRRRFGREALERLVQPLIGGIYTSDPEKLSLHATLSRFVEMERRDRSLILASRREARRADGPPNAESGARYGLFATLRGGLCELIDALVRRVSSAGEVRVSAPVAAISRLAGPEDRFVLSWPPGVATPAETGFDAVIVALPAYRAAEVVRPVDGLLADALNEVEYASSAVVVTGHSLSDVSHPLAASGLVVPAAENRRVLSVSFASRKFADRAPAGKVVLRTFLGGALQPELNALANDELIRVVLDELHDLLGVGGQPGFALVARHERAMPQYHVGHLDRVRRIKRCLSEQPRLAVAGNAYEGLGIPDCIHSGEQAAERIFDIVVREP